MIKTARRNLFPKPPVKFLVRADPKPKPVVIVTTRDGSVVARHADGPRAAVRTQSLQLEAGMRRVLQKFLKGFAGGFPDLRREAVIQFPKICRAARGHFLLRKDLSFSTRKFSGDCECSASSLSRSEERAGRGAASFKMASQPSAGNSPGHSAGMSCTSWRRALAGSFAMASSISSSDFMWEKCVTFSPRCARPR